MANEYTDGATNSERQQIVAFKLRNEEYGVSIANVQEIRNLADITRVPFSQPFIKGVINLRGSVLPVIDLKQRLGLEQTPYTDDTRIVTVTVDELHVGLLVDAVTEVLTLTTKPVDARKAINAKELSRYLAGIGNIDGRLIIMLKLDEIIDLPKDGK